jgi:hypothetical protein
MVSRQGVFLEGGAEDMLRSRNTESIVMEVRTAIAAQTKDPLHLLGGHWSVNCTTTGNFVYTIAGDVPPHIIMTFSKWLCAPFPKAHLIPKTGWAWAQLHGVPVYNDTGVIWAPDDLFVEVRANPIFDNVTFCMPPRWQVPPERIMGDLSTVQVVFVDLKGEVAKQAATMGVYMFGRQVKYVPCGDWPSIVQCGCCHSLDHVTSNCPLPVSVQHCHRCGGAHHPDKHDFDCQGPHQIPGRCNCKPRCILCRAEGHRARAHNCPKCSDFAPPPFAIPGEQPPAPEKSNDDTPPVAGPPLSTCASRRVSPG